MSVSNYLGLVNHRIRADLDDISEIHCSVHVEDNDIRTCSVHTTACARIYHCIRQTFLYACVFQDHRESMGQVHTAKHLRGELRQERDRTDETRVYFRQTHHSTAISAMLDCVSPSLATCLTERLWFSILYLHFITKVIDSPS